MIRFSLVVFASNFHISYSFLLMEHLLTVRINHVFFHHAFSYSYPIALFSAFPMKWFKSGTVPMNWF